MRITRIASFSLMTLVPLIATSCASGSSQIRQLKRLEIDAVVYDRTQVSPYRAASGTLEREFWSLVHEPVIKAITDAVTAKGYTADDAVSRSSIDTQSFPGVQTDDDAPVGIETDWSTFERERAVLFAMHDWVKEERRTQTAATDAAGLVLGIGTEQRRSHLVPGLETADYVTTLALVIYRPRSDKETEILWSRQSESCVTDAPIARFGITPDFTSRDKEALRKCLFPSLRALLAQLPPAQN